MRNSGITPYNLILPPALFILKQIGKVQEKVGLFFSLRRSVFTELEAATVTISSGRFRMWVHAASVGEFEQARPVISALKKSHPDIAVFVSFLSDSGYNARKNYPDADAVFYLPADTPENAEKTASLVKADIFMLMRYDFWPNHLLAAKRHGATMILAAAVLRPGSAYFNPLLKGFYRTVFNLFDRIFTVSENDARAFRERFGCIQAETAGEPRIDQVILRSRHTEHVAHLKTHFTNRSVLVAGSVWEKDEELILEAMRSLQNPPSLILVPHKVDKENIERIEKRLQTENLGSARVSCLEESFDAQKQVLIIDQTGYLLELYSLASIAYVGGGSASMCTTPLSLQSTQYRSSSDPDITTHLKPKLCYRLAGHQQPKLPKNLAVSLTGLSIGKGLQNNREMLPESLYETEQVQQPEFQALLNG